MLNAFHQVFLLWSLVITFLVVRTFLPPRWSAFVADFLHFNNPTGILLSQVKLAQHWIFGWGLLMQEWSHVIIFTLSFLAHCLSPGFDILATYLMNAAPLSILLSGLILSSPVPFLRDGKLQMMSSPPPFLSPRQYEHKMQISFIVAIFVYMLEHHCYYSVPVRTRNN